MIKKRHIILICLLAMTGVYAAELTATTNITFKDEILHIFPDNPESGVIAREQIGDQDLWVGAVRRNGKTRQIRITSYVGGRETRKHTLLKVRYPFGGASATWNMDVKREGDLVSVMIPWNGTLIGDIMDVNEGEDSTADARKKLGLTEPDSKLPVMYSSGDSISMGYWPYLEAELHDRVNVYYQRELAKDIPKIGLRNNGHAHLAYGVLQNAYKNEDFKPDYWLLNFGLHMINTHQNKLPAYGEWVDKFIAYAKEKKVKLIFVNTTPYQQSFRPKQNLTIIKFNELMKMAAEKHDVPVVDLYVCTLAAVKELGDKKAYTDGVHFTEDAKKRQSAYIAKRVREIIGRSE
jgi:lysophospholipase L1-like esterase